MQPTAVQVLTIHDKRGSVLQFDLRDVLQVLGAYLEQWVWCVTELDAVGRDCEELCQAVEASRGAGVWLSSQELVTWAGRISQTIDATLLAFPRSIDRSSLGAEGDWGVFPERAVLVIRAIDSFYFEVLTTDPEIAVLLRSHFQDVRCEDAGLYFGSF
jgi:hypothetical protein